MSRRLNRHAQKKMNAIEMTDNELYRILQRQNPVLQVGDVDAAYVCVKKTFDNRLKLWYNILTWWRWILPPAWECHRTV